MKSFKPSPPFIWPEPRVFEQMSSYDQKPPFSEFVLSAHALFGIVSALTTKGVSVLKAWLERNQALKVRLIVMVYPTCATRQADLSRLLELVEDTSKRLEVYVRPLERVTDRATNTICCLVPDTDEVHMFTGLSEDFGLVSNNEGEINFVFRADPVLVEEFRRYFDWLWGKSRTLTANEVVLIPDLVLPEGTKEGVRLWQEYMRNCLDNTSVEDIRPVISKVDPDTGDVIIRDEEGHEVKPPTDNIGIKKLDSLAEVVARLYEKGSLVSIDKLSRIPPLDAPLDPGIFGDVSELQRGNVKRKVSMRVSIIDEKTLKEIEKRRQGLRTILTKFTFGLADNMRWMPTTARKLFESEIERLNEEGQKLISDLINGDVDEFIKGKRNNLVADVNAMYLELGGMGQVSENMIYKIIENLKDRLSKVKSAKIMPTISYSKISFTSTDNQISSPWGQAFSLLADVAAFPRKALTDSFFFR